MNNNNRGYALLFLNEFAGTVDKLRCHDSDKASLNSCLSNLGFKVVLLENLTKQQTIDQLNKYAGRDHSNKDCFLCVFSSHGNEAGFMTSDRKLIDLTSEIPQIFSGKSSLNGKPKLFFIDACRGRKELGKVKITTGNGAATNQLYIPEVCDIMIYYSSLYKYGSAGFSSGSLFIQSFVKVFDQYGKKVQLMDLVTRTNYEVASNIQMPTLGEYSLRKRIFFK